MVSARLRRERRRQRVAGSCAAAASRHHQMALYRSLVLVWAGNGVTASWVFQRLCDMLVDLDLYFLRTMLGLASVDVLVNCLGIFLLWAGFQLALYGHIFARHGYLRVMWSLVASELISTRRVLVIFGLSKTSDMRGVWVVKGCLSDFGVGGMLAQWRCGGCHHIT